MKKNFPSKLPETDAEEDFQPDSEDLSAKPEPKFVVDEPSASQRLDQFLATRIENVSRARVQQMIEQNCVRVAAPDGTTRAAKASMKLRTGETVVVIGEAEPPPLRAEAEAIPLDMIYEDEFLAVVNKRAGMMVHAGAGATDDARNRGTLVNALLHHMQSLSAVGGGLRPGIVHRLDKQTSGLIIVAKDDVTHRRLGEMFANREIHKTYLALVHGRVKLDQGTVNTSISRDPQRRTRMTAHRSGGRTAISHYRVRQRIESRYGQFTLLEVKIETGRTHQIRVHLSSIGHPVVGDTLYGAPSRILPRLEAPMTRARRETAAREAVSLDRNFLHAMRLEFVHPRSGRQLRMEAPLPGELTDWLQQLVPATP